MQVGGSDAPEPDNVGAEQELCGKWMPRKKTTCARTPGHGGDCATGENMENRRAYRRVHPHRASVESSKRSKRKYRISLYGLTEASFAELLSAQDYASELQVLQGHGLVTRDDSRSGIGGRWKVTADALSYLG